MKIDIDDQKLNNLAMSLRTSPEILIKKLFEHVANFPQYATNEIYNRSSSLDNMLEIMIENSELGYTFDHLVKRTMQDRRYRIEYCDYDRDDGIIWVEINLIGNGGNESTSSIYLQFGNHPLIRVDGYIDNIKTDINLSDLEEEISDKIEFFPLIEEAKDSSLDLELLDDTLQYTLEIEFEDALQLPKLSDVDDIMALVRETILSRLNS